MITVKDHSLKNQMDAASPNVLADACRILKLGSVLRAITTFLRKKAPAASSSQLAAVQSIALPDDAKAVSILSAYARAGAGTVGPLAIVAAGATPAAGQVAVAPNGDLAFLAADAWTSVDVTYQPDKYDLAEVTLPVAGGVLTLPAQVLNAGAVTLLEAEATAVSSGTATGNKVILVPGTAPAAGQARLSVAKGTVLFAGADNVSSARVKLAIVASTDVDSLLTGIASVA